MQGSIRTQNKGRPFGWGQRAAHVALIALVALAGSVVSAAAVAAADATVRITTTLTPKSLTVEPGTRVTWTNDDGERHRIRSRSGPIEFDSGNLDTGESYSFTFSSEGTYSYVDARDDDNASYHGTVVVTSTSPAPGDPPPADPPPSGGNTVSMFDRRFAPRTMTIQAGVTVEWLNDDDRIHTATANDGSFDSGIMAVGDTYRRRFDTTGTYPYFCTIHPDMTGTITVTDPTGTPPPPPEPTPPPEPPAPPPPPPVTSGDISIVDFGYTPTNLTIGPGATVTWANNGIAPHTVTDRNGTFDSGFLLTADTYRRRFDTTGTYPYFCTIHPDMTGTITVTDPTGTPPPPPEPTPPPEPPAPPPPPPVTSGDISIVDFGYTPTNLTIGPGATVTWANNGIAPHTVTDRNGTFDSGFLLTADTYRRRFDTTGTYPYFCTIHPDMTGTITVTDPTGTPPPPPEPIPAPEAVEPLSGLAPAEGAPTVETNSAPNRVRVIDFAFEAEQLVVALGTRVEWTNMGVAPHTVTSRTGSFDSGIMESGAVFALQFDEPGTYEYWCTLHPTMVGAVTVSSAKGTAAAAVTDPAGPAGGEDLRASTGGAVSAAPVEGEPPGAGAMWVYLGVLLALLMGAASWHLIFLIRRVVASPV